MLSRPTFSFLKLSIGHVVQFPWKITWLKPHYSIQFASVHIKGTIHIWHWLASAFLNYSRLSHSLTSSVDNLKFPSFKRFKYGNWISGIKFFVSYSVHSLEEPIFRCSSSKKIFYAKSSWCRCWILKKNYTKDIKNTYFGVVLSKIPFHQTNIDHHHQTYIDQYIRSP